MWPDGSWHISILGFILRPLLLLQLFLLVPEAHGALTARPAAWRPVPELPHHHQGADDRADVTAAVDPAMSLIPWGSDQHTTQHSGKNDLRSGHGPVPHSRWPAMVPAHLINWDHPQLQASAGGAPPLTPALALATLRDGSQGTSDVIKAITQYQLIR